jgi:hypothetical protein
VTDTISIAEYSALRRKNKFNAKPTVVDNIRFASRAEARRYGELKLLEKAGEIHHLELQPRYDFTVNGIYVGYYTADFKYLARNGLVVEDVKSRATMTEAYRIRKKLMRAVWAIEISEVA